MNSQGFKNIFPAGREVVASKPISPILISVAVAWSLAMVFGYDNGFAVSNASAASFYGKPGVERVIKRIGPKAESRIKPFFERAGVPYPSQRLSLIILKLERKLEVWAEDTGKWVHVRTYDIHEASGWQGPKLKEGDRQVPEGIYRITALNPASRYHLSMKINYPNSYDLKRARDDGRWDLGGDIFIHGRAASRGCIAVGNVAIEELFLLVAKTGRNRVSVIIAPNDLRKNGCEANLPSQPSWLPDLYKTIAQELVKFKVREEAQNVTLSGNM